MQSVLNIANTLMNKLSICKHMQKEKKKTLWHAHLLYCKPVVSSTREVKITLQPSYPKRVLTLTSPGSVSTLLLVHILQMTASVCLRMREGGLGELVFLLLNQAGLLAKEF